MKTGEGKTLVSTLPAYLNGLTGKGVHLVTVNDYLASRDADWMGQIHRWLGLSVGLVVPQIEDFTARQQAYAADITYGTNTEFGFDYLRDNMRTRREEMVQRGAAHQLHVVVELPDHPARRLPDGGERLEQQVVEVLAVGQALPELDRVVAQRLVGERGVFVGEGADVRDERLQGPQLLALADAQNLGEDAHADDWPGAVTVVHGTGGPTGADRRGAAIAASPTVTANLGAGRRAPVVLRRGI